MLACEEFGIVMDAAVSAAREGARAGLCDEVLVRVRCRLQPTSSQFRARPYILMAKREETVRTCRV
jgi:hypothetical protein